MIHERFPMYGIRTQILGNLYAIVFCSIFLLSCIICKYSISLCSFIISRRRGHSIRIFASDLFFNGKLDLRLFNQLLLCQKLLSQCWLVLENLQIKRFEFCNNKQNMKSQNFTKPITKIIAIQKQTSTTSTLILVTGVCKSAETHSILLTTFSKRKRINFPLKM